MTLQPDHWFCAFWVDQLNIGNRARSKDNTIGDKQKADYYNDDLSVKKSIAESVLSDCLEQQNVPLGCLVAEFLFRNGKPFEVASATNCQITSSAYLNYLRNSNRLTMGQFLAQILPQFGCSMPLHSFAILAKMLKANLHSQSIAQQINPKQLVHLWHHCFYQRGRSGPNELNKSIAKNLTAIFNVVGPAPSELFRHFLFQVPYFIRHKYLLMQYLLSACPLDQLDETVLFLFFDQLAFCLECRWFEAELADAFHALALRFVQMNKVGLITQSISKTLSSNNETVRENAVRLWFPKLNTSHALRQIFTNLCETFRPTLTSSERGNVEQSECKQQDNAHLRYSSPPYWFYDDFVDPAILWSAKEINLWAFLQLVHWTLKNQQRQITIPDAWLDDLDIVVSALIGCHKDETKKIAADSLALIFSSKRPKEWHPTQFGPPIQQLISNFEHLLRSENATLCNSINLIFFNLCKFYGQKIDEAIQCQLHKLLKQCTEHIDSTNFCSLISNLLYFVEKMNIPENGELINSTALNNFLLNALVYGHDSTVRQRSAQMAFQIAKDCADFKSRLITLFNDWAPILKYGIVHLYRLLLCLRIDERELNLHFIANEDGLNILATRIKIEQFTPHKNAISDLLSHCVSVNEKLLKIGGSDCAAQCVTISELHLLFENTADDEDGENDAQLLFWSDTQKKQLCVYSNGIIQSCSAIRWVLTNFTDQMDEHFIQNGLRSIWTVLLRSHHKGVLEHCGSDFGASVEHLCETFPSFPQLCDEIVEKTLSILARGGGQCRNIAFSKILLPIFASIGTVQRTEFVSRIIAFDFDQNSAFPLDQTKLHLHQLFLLKELLSTTKFDLIESRGEIFHFIMRIIQISMDRGQTERWRLFSMAANAFAALLHSIFRHLPAIIPLNNFFTVERNFCDNLLISLRNIHAKLAHKQRSEPSLALLLVPLQRLFVSTNPIEHCSSANQFVAELSSELNQIIRLEPSYLLRTQIAYAINNLNGKMPTPPPQNENGWPN